MKKWFTSGVPTPEKKIEPKHTMTTGSAATNQSFQTMSPAMQVPGTTSCNICQNSAFKATPSGRLSTNNLPPVCTNCGSLERHRAFRSIFNQFRTPEFKTMSCLMLGKDPSVAGGWFKSMRYSDHGAETPLDTKNIGLLDGEYDVVIGNRVFEQVQDYEDALKELIGTIPRRGFAFLSFANPHYRKITSDWGYPKADMNKAYRSFGSDIEAKLPKILPGVGILRVIAKDPVTQTEDRAYIFSQNYELLDQITDKGVTCRFLRS